MHMIGTYDICMDPEESRKRFLGDLMGGGELKEKQV